MYIGPATLERADLLENATFLVESWALLSPENPKADTSVEDAATAARRVTAENFMVDYKKSRKEWANI